MNAARRDELLARGVIMPHPEQVLIAADVLAERIEAGARLEAGCRLEGPRTLIRAGAHLGAAGPVVLRDSAVGVGVSLASGCFESSLFLEGASFGPCGQARVGTLFEEGASAAHATGTKQTILLPWATLGSNVNFCDVLLSGGSRPGDHSEVGSGCIHFNFTPFGPRGDKATASLLGDVEHGAWLGEARIFVGGASGLVGPLSVGFGTVLAAGSVYRRDRGSGVLVLGESLPAREVPFDSRILRRVGQRVQKNLDFMAQVVALRHFYRAIRLPLSVGDELQAELVRFGLDLLQNALVERAQQLARLGEGVAASLEALSARSGIDPSELRAHEVILAELPRCALVPEAEGELGDAALHQELSAFLPAGSAAVVDWIRALPEQAICVGQRYLASVSEAYKADPAGAGRILQALSTV